MRPQSILMLLAFFIVSSCAQGPAIDSGQVAAVPAVGPSAVAADDGVEIAYTVHRIADPTLVLVHGWMCDQSYWRRQVPALAKDYGVVTIDLAGHGNSGLDRQDWTIASLGGDVKAVVEHLKLKRVIVVGHSMGGRVALEAARLMPQTVIGVIGVDTLQDADAKVPPEQAKALLAAFENDFATSCDGFVREMFGPEAETSLIDRIAADMCSGPGSVGTALLRDYVAYDTASAMKAAGVPVRCVNSDKWPTNVEGNRKYCDFGVTILQGFGHFLMQEAPDELNAALGETVKDILRSS